jgi:hypothetical protein
MLLTKKITTPDGAEFEVREPTIGMLMQTSSEALDDGRTMLRLLLANCVYQDGKKMGDAVFELPARYLNAISAVVTEVSGMGNADPSATSS